MNEKNHNRQAAWLARGWGKPEIDVRKTKLLTMDFDKLARHCRDNGSRWIPWEQAKCFLETQTAEKTGMDFANPFTADKLYISEIENSIKPFFDNFNVKSDAIESVSDEERLNIDRMVAMHISRQPATIKEIQKELIYRFSQGSSSPEKLLEIDFTAIEGRCGIQKDFVEVLNSFLQVLTDNTLSDEEKHGVLNGTEEMAKKKEDGLGPKLIGYLMYSAYAKMLAHLQTLDFAKFKLDGTKLPSVPHSFITGKHLGHIQNLGLQVNCIIPSPKFEFKDVWKNESYCFGPISATHGAFYSPKGDHEGDSPTKGLQIAEFFQRTFELSFLSHPSGVIVFDDEVSAETFYKTVSVSRVTPIKACDFQNKEPLPFQVKIGS